jgi:hypothetical protein
LGRAAQSEGVSKSTTDVTLLLARVTPLLFQVLQDLLIPPNALLVHYFKAPT